jgi:hypothetical protein
MWKKSKKIQGREEEGEAFLVLTVGAHSDREGETRPGLDNTARIQHDAGGGGRGVKANHDEEVRLNCLQ